MPIADKLQAAAEREASLQDTLTATFARELQQVLKLATQRARTLIRQIDKNGTRISTEQALGRVLQLRVDLTRVLDAAGYHQLVSDAVDAPLDTLASQVLKTSSIANKAATLSAFDVEALTAFKELRLADLFDVADDVGRALWRTVLDGVLSVRPTDELITDVEDLIDASWNVARTVYDTAVSTYGRQVDQLQSSGRPDEAFLYVGPVDGKARPFCLDHVGKVFTRTQIDAMDNGQLPNVLLTGGGYNCRHAFKRVSILDDELQAMVGTNDRMPHVEAQLKEVAA